MGARAIIHLNVADFAVAVERGLDPRLRSRPVVIAPEDSARAAVYDMSEEAYAAGVRKGMPLPRARRVCRDAAVLPPHPDRYEQAMRALLDCAAPYSPLIEVTDLQGHLFVDATGTGRLWGPPRDVAWRIRNLARAELGLDPIWTVAPNKLVAKVASRVVKPVGECWVEPGEEEAFLRPLPVGLLPGLEPEELLRFREYRLAAVGDVARWSLAQLAVVFGARARFVHDAARGRDAAPVPPLGQAAPQAAADHEFGEDTNDTARVRAALYGLTETAGRALRARALVAWRVGVFVDYSDGARCVRQASARRPTANDFALFELAQKALDLAWTRRVRLRHLRLVCDRLTPPPAQLDLFAGDDPGERRRDRLAAALDTIRGRFGNGAIRVGRTLENVTPPPLVGGGKGEGAAQRPGSPSPASPPTPGRGKPCTARGANS